MLPKPVAQFLRGFTMGAADIVPGVSGGTIALIFGIYHELLDTVKDGARALGRLAKGDVKGFKDQFLAINWAFILPLGVGVLLAVGLLSSLIEGALKDYPEAMAGLFMGLVLASIIIAWGLMKAPEAKHMAIIVAVGLFMFWVLGFQNGPVNDPSLPIYFGAGAIAICAMILPGISGSFLLLMMGMYATVLGVIHDRAIVEILVFGLGATVGLAVFSTFLHKVLDQNHDELMAILIGLMVGSMRVLWPWPNGVGIISEEEGESVSGVGLDLPTGDTALWPIVFCVLAFALVMGVSEVGKRMAPQS